ncbi:MAG: YciI family protein [Intrasporangium sp.]|uniref:YciI family protein n=1 Tax=Intrasporangium sp. TaxID=1925024 RepID=UPI002646FCF9|nr:YciI family protein [Intrasporangium sp.]MDN5797296.1 YciI family protein [Intrasporangium sp.]
MKYIMLSYGTQADWDAGAEYAQAHPDEQFGPADGFAHQLIATGEFVYAAGLSDPTHTQWVTPSEGGSVVTDGPYAEAKEHLMSFGIVDVGGNERALEIAGQMSGVFGRVEVRPLEGGGVDDV